jgi:hypothetical protein
MSEKTYHFPSLVRLGDWALVLGGKNDKWDNLLRAWDRDGVLTNWHTGNALVPNQNQELADVGRLPLRLARSASHLGGRGSGLLDHLPVWDPLEGVNGPVLATGVFRHAPSGSWWIQLHAGGTSLDKDDAMPLLHPRGLAGVRLMVREDWRARPSVLYHLLEDSPGAREPWYLLASSGVLRGPTPDTVRFTSYPNVAFDALNHALGTVRGILHGSRPFQGAVPSFEAVHNSFDPLLLTALEDRSSSTQRAWAPRFLRMHLGEEAKNEPVRAHLDWYSASRDGTSAAPRTGFTLQGLLDDSYRPDEFRFSWDAANAQRQLATFQALRTEAERGEPVASFQLKECRPAADAHWIRFGSVEIKPVAAATAPEVAACKLEFNAYRDVVGRSSDIFPDVHLAGLRCLVRYAAGDDPVPIYASLDGGDAAEERNRRETPPIVGFLGQDERTATLEMRTRYQRGHDAVTQLTLVVDQPQQPGDSSAVWLNLRPFIAAQVQFGVTENNRTTLVWRSDDAQGAQWRLEHETVRVTLPPQAVGEEMERGRRFYPDAGTPTIDAAAPVRYRFSRPAYLVLRPSPAYQKRRFERSPLNLREILRNASIDRMQVEMAYPLEITYEKSEHSALDLRVSEAGEFFGRPSEALHASELDLRAGAYQPGRLEEFVRELTEPDLTTYMRSVQALVQRQHEVEQVFAARLAELHVLDPKRPKKDLRLVEDISFRLRDKRHGAPPLMNPLPSSSGYAPDPTRLPGEFGHFLSSGTWGQPREGAIRAGLVHTFELASELLEVLAKPEAVSGEIGALALSALGATGRMEASFAQGKTSFTVVVMHGQLARLVKTRIGRIGALWNRAKHVVVYERTAARSQQFKDEQSSQPANGWPILRKSEEYIEPIEVERRFREEDGAAAGNTGFIAASVFASRRIYVNGAWARDVKQGDAFIGYELPLWDRKAAELDPKFYPRPQVFLHCHGEEEQMTRLWFREPENLYFFTSTQERATADTNAWPPLEGIDFSNLPWWPVMEAVAPGQPRTPADPALSTSTRFDLATDAESPVNLQHGRGATPMLARLQRVSISRTGNQSASNLAEDAKLQPAVAAMQVAQAALTGAAHLAPSVNALKADLMDRLERQLHAGLSCKDIEADLAKAVQLEMAKVRARLDPLAGTDLFTLIDRGAGVWHQAVAQFTSDMRRKAVMPDTVIRERLMTTLGAARDVLAPFAGTPAQVLPPEVQAGLRTAEAELRGLGDELKDRADRQLAQAVAACDAALKEAAQKAEAAANHLANGAITLEQACASARQALAGAAAAYERLPQQAREVVEPVTGLLQLLLRQCEALERSAALLGQVSAAARASIHAGLKDAMQALAGLAADLRQQLIDPMAAVVNVVATGIAQQAAALRTWALPLATVTIARDAVAALKALEANAGKDAQNLLDNYNRQVDQLAGAFTAAADAVATRLTDPQGPLKALASKVRQANGALSAIPNELESKLLAIIAAAGNTCEQVRRQLGQLLDEAGTWAREQAKAALGSVLSAEAGRQIEEYARTAQHAWDQGARALSLARAVGDLPKLTPLQFDIDVAAYVFDGKLPQIQMTPAIARLQHEGEKLLESLGLAVPCQQLLDGLTPAIPRGFGFSDVFTKFAGMDFKGMFERFRLPALDDKNIQVKHGLDRATRRAWVNATVDFAHPEYEELFAFGPVALGLQKMKLDAFSGVEVRVVDNRPLPPEARTSASLVADWMLYGAGQMLVRFKQVAIRYDGVSGFGFNVSPENIELNPALKFMSDFVERIKGELPPAIEIEEKNGRPVGVSAGTAVVIADATDFGAVTIGPIDMRSRLGLRLDEGRFTIRSAFSLGNKQSPIFVQISWLGGGCWLEARADYVDGRVTPAVSVGLSLGSTKSFNLAGVAKGSYNVQLYCYIEIQGSSNSVAIGLSLVGSALIIGFVNASVSLLLEARHQGGSTEGTGRLDVSVRISWFYTFRFKQTVRHKF